MLKCTWLRTKGKASAKVWRGPGSQIALLPVSPRWSLRLWFFFVFLNHGPQPVANSAWGSWSDFSSSYLLLFDSRVPGQFSLILRILWPSHSYSLVTVNNTHRHWFFGIWVLNPLDVESGGPLEELMEWSPRCTLIFLLYRFSPLNREGPAAFRLWAFVRHQGQKLTAVIWLEVIVELKWPTWRLSPF